MIIHVSDARKLGLCLKGQKEFFRRNNLDFRDYVENGIESDRVSGFNDGNANMVIDRVKERSSDGR